MKKSIEIKQKLSRSKLFNRFLQILPGQILLWHPLRYIMIEPTNICNLRCLFCTQSISQRPKGTMAIEVFNKILALLPNSIKEAQLHFAGESVLNRDLALMVEGLKSRGFRTVLSSNGNLAFENYEKIIRAGLDELIISFDGASKETYDQYRERGDFEAVSANIRKISQIPERKIKLIIQFLVMRHNEDEIEKIKELAKKLGADELWLKSTSLNIGSSQIMEKNIIENAKKFLPQSQKYSRYILSDGKLIHKDKPLSCPWIWRTVILWNGDVAVCCVDLEGEIIVGNILKEGSFDKIWRSKRYHQLRKKILKRELKICRNCNVGDNPIKEVVKL